MLISRSQVSVDDIYKQPMSLISIALIVLHFDVGIQSQLADQRILLSIAL